MKIKFLPSPNSALRTCSCGSGRSGRRALVQRQPDAGFRADDPGAVFDFSALTASRRLSTRVRAHRAATGSLADDITFRFAPAHRRCASSSSISGCGRWLPEGPRASSRLRHTALPSHFCCGWRNSSIDDTQRTEFCDRPPAAAMLCLARPLAESCGPTLLRGQWCWPAVVGLLMISDVRMFSPQIPTDLAGRNGCWLRSFSSAPRWRSSCADAPCQRSSLCHPDFSSSGVRLPN